MKIDFKGIIEGAWNSVFVKEGIEAVATERYSICKECPYNSKNTPTGSIRQDAFCLQCGCNLHLKTRCLSCKCPIDKWGEVMSEEQEKIIDKKLESE